jgi:hypothetical protein
LLRLPALLRQQSFYVFTQVLHLEFRNWWWIPHKLSDDQKRTRIQFAVSL